MDDFKMNNYESDEFQNHENTNNAQNSETEKTEAQHEWVHRRNPESKN